MIKLTFIIYWTKIFIDKVHSAKLIKKNLSDESQITLCHLIDQTFT